MPPTGYNSPGPFLSYTIGTSSSPTAFQYKLENQSKPEITADRMLKQRSINFLVVFMTEIQNLTLKAKIPF